VLRNAGHEIFCSLEFEGWQVSSNTDATYALETDFAEISKADRLLVLLEERTSSGVQLEMGYAHAKGKEIEMYQMGKTSWSNKTFGQLDGHTVIAVKNTSDFAERIIAAYTAQE
jgi:nucleoside 2-deoxyribosyltransferase